MTGDRHLWGNSVGRQIEGKRVHAETDNFTIDWKIELPPECSFYEQWTSVKSFEFTWVKQNMIRVLHFHKKTCRRASQWTHCNPFRLKCLNWRCHESLLMNNFQTYSTSTSCPSYTLEGLSLIKRPQAINMQMYRELKHCRDITDKVYEQQNMKNNWFRYLLAYYTDHSPLGALVLKLIWSYWAYGKKALCLFIQLAFP